MTLDGADIGGGLGRGRELPNIPSNSDAELLLVELSGEAEEGVIVTVGEALEAEGKIVMDVEAFAGARLGGKDVAFEDEVKIETFDRDVFEELVVLGGFEAVVIGELVESV